MQGVEEMQAYGLGGRSIGPRRVYSCKPMTLVNPEIGGGVYVGSKAICIFTYSQGVLLTNSTNSTPRLDILETFTERIGGIQPTGTQDWLELDELAIHPVTWERSGDLL